MTNSSIPPAPLTPEELEEMKAAVRSAREYPGGKEDFGWNGVDYLERCIAEIERLRDDRPCCCGHRPLTMEDVTPDKSAPDLPGGPFIPSAPSAS